MGRIMKRGDMALRLFLAVIVVLAVGPSIRAQQAPKELTACEVAKDPASFDKRTIRVRGTLSADFEDFSLVENDCGTDQHIWLAFGGDVGGLVFSTMNDYSRKPG